ncbi:hypothetical protein E2C01_023158 [Portunus trituberculatus]|uniref:Uncharacterized protein n=1 Tax=Portunus trituberculatus TaxID=210409 RepID=A0A5B7E9N0_PORTR|nr:hypothetical protein [Portunus trituberculatus]
MFIIIVVDSSVTCGCGVSVWYCCLVGVVVHGAPDKTRSLLGSLAGASQALSLTYSSVITASELT